MSDVAAQPRRNEELSTYYDRLADTYGSGEVFAARRQAIIGLIQPELSKAQGILDLGCGNGTYTAAFANVTPDKRIIGLDLSPEMLAVAANRVAGHARFVRGDAVALPFGSEAFDLVFMSHVLQLIDDVESCAAAIERILSHGGVWISTLGMSGWRESILQHLGPEALRQLASLVAGNRLPRPIDQKDRVVAVCEKLGLAIEWRQAAFSADWTAMEEWVRIRWLTVVDDASRGPAQKILESMRQPAAKLSFEISETVFVARKH